MSRLTQRLSHHGPAQHAAWLAVDTTLEAWAAADYAERHADPDSAEYPALLAAARRAERELDGAWAHYHRI